MNSAPAVVSFIRVYRKKIMTLLVSKKRISIFERDKYLCQYCGKLLTLEQCSIDHKIATSRKGTNGSLNLVTCCSSCNSSKGPRSIEAFRLTCRVKKSPYASVVQGHTVKKLINLGIEFSLLEEHLFFFEQREEK